MGNTLLEASSNGDLPVVNPEFIRQIESSGDPKAHNKKEDARGLHQIRPIVLKEWNNYNPKEKYQGKDLFDPNINKKIGEWYLNYRIPQMLQTFGKPITLENIITSYNAGIEYVVKEKPIPKTTQDYLAKYYKLMQGVQ